jgi:4-hydroxybenzoate polyprenyltransferase
MFVYKIFRLTRIKAYLPTLLAIIVLIFLISPQNLVSALTVKVFFANLFLTAFVYAFNDVEDAENDICDLEKRKRNPISSGDLTKKQGYFLSFLLLITGLIFLYLINLLLVSFGLALVLVGFLYSWKPVRFKSIPIIDIISHVLCLGAIQFFIIYLAFSSFNLMIIPFLMIIIPSSLMIDVFYELKDFDVDKKTKMSNTVQKFGRFNAKKLFIVSSVIIILGFSIIIFNISKEYLLTF